MSARITAVNVVHEVLPDGFGEVPWTAIDKRPVSGPVAVEPLGLAGDKQCDLVNHGGPFQAVYAYADEDAEWWASELGRPIPAGLFGENLRTSGLDVTGAEIGEQWLVGAGDDAVLMEVTSPRVPCRTFSDRMAEPHWIKRFTDHGAPGAYLRVLRTGRVRPGDPVQVVRRPGHGIGVGDVFLRAEPATMFRLLAVAEADGMELSPSLREHAERIAARV